MLACDFNRSMRHLNSNCRERDVENETKTQDLLLRYTEGVHVGSVVEPVFGNIGTNKGLNRFSLR